MNIYIQNAMSDNEQQQRQKCNRCKVNLTIDKFKVKRCGNAMKQCIECNEKGTVNRNKNRCEHGKYKSRCVTCGGSAICEHNRERSRCKDCGGSSICEHGKRLEYCVTCGGSAICEHNKVRSRCKDCCGGSICEHNKVRYVCKECGGSAICEHGREKHTCKECDPCGHLKNIVSCSVRQALKSGKSKKSLEYLGCTIDEFKKHIESKFKENMSWDNYGEWQIDHITPIKYKDNEEAPTIENVIERLHWTNTQPMWAVDNMSKGNRFIG